MFNNDPAFSAALIDQAGDGAFVERYQSVVCRREQLFAGKTLSKMGIAGSAHLIAQCFRQNFIKE